MKRKIITTKKVEIQETKEVDLLESIVYARLSSTRPTDLIRIIPCFYKGELLNYKITIIDSPSIREVIITVESLIHLGKVLINGIDITSIFYNESPNRVISEEQFNQELENKFKYFKITNFK